MTEKEKLDSLLGETSEPNNTVNEEQISENAVNESKEVVNEQPQQSQPQQYRRLSYDVASRRPLEEVEETRHFAQQKGLATVGKTIGVDANGNAIGDGWIPVDKSILGDRAIYYPDDWQFRIRPATVEAIRNWSTIDEENINVIDNVFNEVLKSCLSIYTEDGPKPWGNIRSWDRFFFLLLIREYTFMHGEKKISYTEYCPECDNEITFELTSDALMYEFPDPEIMSMFDRSTMTWVIDPSEYDIDEPIMTFYLPTLEKDANIKEWVIRKVRENNNAKIDQVFLRILPWMAPKISKDETIARRQIRELELKYRSWDADTFSFVDEVIKNIIVQPLQKITKVCPICGEEATSRIRFPNSVRDIFNVSNKHKKFGTK